MVSGFQNSLVILETCRKVAEALANTPPEIIPVVDKRLETFVQAEECPSKSSDINALPDDVSAEPELSSPDAKLP